MNTHSPCVLTIKSTLTRSRYLARRWQQAQIEGSVKKLNEKVCISSCLNLALLSRGAAVALRRRRDLTTSTRLVRYLDHRSAHVSTGPASPSDGYSAGS